MLWRMQVLAARAANPSPPAYIYSGKIIRPTRELPTDTLKPIGLRNWLGCVLPEMFNVDENKTLIQLQEESDYGFDGLPTDTGDLVQRQLRAHKRPPAPTTALRYQICSQHLSRFMLETNRWDMGEAALHDSYVNFCMRRMEQHPIEDVLLYDSDFRMKRHVLQDKRWLVTDENLLRKRMTDPALARTQAAQAGLGSSPPTSATQATTTKDFLARPCYAKLSHHGKQVCAKWNWGVGCVTCGPSTDVSECDGQRVHVCSFCNGMHKVMDCDEYKVAHPADHARGYAGK